MQTTKNIGLYLEDEDTTKFVDWRNKIAGVSESSNMQKIDAAFGEKADKSKTLDFVLSPTAWVGETTPYTQEVTLADVVEDSNGIIGLSRNASQEQVEAAIDAQLDLSAQSDGSVTVTASGVKPEIELSVSLIILY